MKLPKVNKDTGYYLRIFRAERNINQGQAAKYFGISRSMWCLLEGGQRRPGWDLAVKLGQATGAPLELFADVKHG